MDHQRGHVLILPYPSQGRINPLLQFGKRLAHHDLLVTLATTRYILATTPNPGPLTIALISDGLDDGGYTQADSIPAYLDRLDSAGSETLAALIESDRAESRPVSVLVYDALLPWALDVGKRLGITCAAFFTQSCAVGVIYRHGSAGRLSCPAEAAVELPGLPLLEPGDMPSYLTDLVPGPYLPYLYLVLNQFSNLDGADVVLFNTFYEPESKIPSDSHYGFNLYIPDTGHCMTWLDSKCPNSVVYVSFGSMSDLTVEQTKEIARALQNIRQSFLWVVRTSEMSKLPADFVKATSQWGLVVSWSPQLEVLAHPSVRCFVTHCGWNSTTEGLCLAVPMVGVPQWSDQQTNAKYVNDVWEVGVRVKVDENKVVWREEMEKCIREVMEGERSEEMRNNARKWRETAKATVSEGGSSNKNMVEFIAKYCS